LILNKFPVIPNHFIIATKAYKSQTDLLEKEDLRVTFSCLKEWEEHKEPASFKRLFAFFNSGEHSGASQPHRHLQFLPVENMIQENDGQNWRPLIDGLLDTAVPGASGNRKKRHRLPFAHFAVTLPPDPSADELHCLYLSLYRMAVKAAYQYAGSTLNNLEYEGEQTEGPSVISYNLAMTTATMMICPRRSESAWIPLKPELRTDVVDAGLVKLNGTILAGTLMVKAEVEWNELRNQPTLLEHIFETVGIPSPRAQI
jgi:ATP adenylyltransferase